jgi:hypothetical protein
VDSLNQWAKELRSGRPILRVIDGGLSDLD